MIVTQALFVTDKALIIVDVNFNPLSEEFWVLL